MLEFTQKLTQKNCYIGKNKPSYIVIHETDNWNKGTGAKAHATAMFNGNLSGTVHYYVDDVSIYQTLRHEDGAWAVGDGKGKYGITNLNSINIEICVNPESNFYNAVKNCNDLVKKLIKEIGIPVWNIGRHYDASRKNCPRRIMSENLWDKFKKDLVETPTDPVKDRWINQNGRWWWQFADGSWPANEWKVINGKWYAFDERGWMRTGWFLDSTKKWYYLDPVDGYMKTGWVLVNNKWYYLDPSNGDMKIGWVKVIGKWYYLNPNGDMRTGWVWWNGEWYWLKEYGNMATNEIIKINNKDYVFAESGYMRRTADMEDGKLD